MTKLLAAVTFLLTIHAARAEDPAATLYLLGYDVPVTQREQVLTQDVATLKADLNTRYTAPLWRIIQGKAEPSPPQLARDTYPDLDIAPFTLCSAHAVDDCISDISANPQPYRDSLHTLAPLLRDIDHLEHSQAEALRSPFQGELASVYAPLPSYQYLIRPLLTRNAVALHDDPAQGAAQTCTAINFGKNLIRSHDSLIQTMIGATILDQQLDLLAHYPQSHLPEACQSALQPLDSTAISLCPLMQYEADFYNDTIRSLPNIPPLLSHTYTNHRIQQQLAPYCSAAWQHNLSADRMAKLAAHEAQPPRSDCLLNVIGCTLSDVAASDYSVYQNRLQDSNAHLRLWQATRNPACAQDPAAYLKHIAPDWADARHLHLDQQGRLSIDTYYTDKRQHIRVACQPSPR